MLKAARFQAEGGWRMTGHGHPDWHICVVIDGAFAERIGGEEIACQAGAVRLSRPGVRHDLEFSRAGADCLIVEANGAFWNRVLARPIDGDHLFRQLTQQGLGAIGPDGGDGLWLTGLLQTIGPQDDRPAWAEDARQEIESGSPRSLSALAEDCGLDREDFARQFRRQFGFRPAEHRTLARLGLASTRLRETDQPLAELALDCGFAHQSHMTNAFRAILGVSPGHLRAGARS